MNVSSSRAPPPNVTTTVLAARGSAAARNGAYPNKLPNPARVTVRKMSRRFHEIACATSCGLPERQFAGSERFLIVICPFYHDSVQAVIAGLVWQENAKHVTTSRAGWSER